MITLYKTDLAGHKREYFCLSADVTDLPNDKEMFTGCSAYCVDTGDVYLWDSENEQWRKQ